MVSPYVCTQYVLWQTRFPSSSSVLMTAGNKANCPSGAEIVSSLPLLSYFLCLCNQSRQLGALALNST